MFFKKKEIKEIERNIIEIEKSYARNLLPIRYPNSNKGTYGTVLNIAGCLSYPGAAFLSSISTLKVGAGLCCLATESNALSIIASNTPDIIFTNLGSSDKYTIPRDAVKNLKDISKYRAVSIGCGLSTEKSTRDFVLKFLNKNLKSDKPFVIDADAINILASTDNMPIPSNAVITPHPLELSRIMDMDVEEIQEDRVKSAAMAADYLGCMVVLKGKDTVIAAPDEKEVYINKTGNSALSKGGAGDVLTGMISGFLAQGLKMQEAVHLAVYLHGRAGEIGSNTLTEYSVLSSNLINYIPIAIKDLQGY